MSHIAFAEFPDHARVWVFAAPRPLSEAEADRLLERVDHFLAQWHAHGRPVVGARDWRHDQFLLVAADEQASGVSGCSIDSLFHTLAELERELGTSLRDSAPVWYRGRDGGVRSCSRAEFRQLSEHGQVDADTVVFDNTVATLGAVRNGEWERPLRTSWHARAFAAALRA